MTAVLGVRFQPHGTLHLLRLGQHQRFTVGDSVLYPTEGGPAVCTVVWTGEAQANADVPVCLGAASAADLLREDADRQRRAEIEVAARNLIARHGLPMKVLAVDHQQPQSGRPLAVIYYQAPGRVDFRALLIDLGRVLRCRLDLRQVGERDAARMVCDLGSCGRASCCTTCLQVLEAQTGRATQAATMGTCGRVVCCLRFEEPSPGRDCCAQDS